MSEKDTIAAALHAIYPIMKNECKKCGRSWRQPKNVIYKDGMCIPCYFSENDFLANNNNLDAWLK